MPKCAQCGFEQTEARQNCVFCGAPMEDAHQAQQFAERPSNAGGCRAAYCVSCGNRMPEQGRFCAFCGARAVDPASAEEMIPVSEPYYAEPDLSREPPEQKPPKEKKRRRPVAVLVAVMCLLLVCALTLLATQLVPVLLRSGTAAGEQPIIYVQDGDALRFKHSAMNGPETITSAYDYQVDYESQLVYDTHATSGDGRYLLYLNDFRRQGSDYQGKGDLYIRDLTQHSGSGRPTERGTKIASDVTTDFYFSENDSYVFFITTRGELYVWDFQETWKLDSDVTGIYAWDDAQVLYYKGDEADSFASYFSSRDVYLAPLAQGIRRDKVKIDSDISNLVDWNDSFTRFVYTKATGRGDEVRFDVYLNDIKEDTRETLITDVDGVVDALADSGMLLYAVGLTSSITFDDIIEDDMKEADERIQEPDLSDYPTLERYEEGWYFYDDEEELDIDAFYDELERYEEAYKEYEQKLNRDRLREKIADDLSWKSGYDMKVYDLYYLQDGERIKIDSGVYSSYSSTTGVYGNLENRYAAYLKVDTRDIERRKLSEIENSWYMYSFDVEEHLRQNLSGDLYFTFLDGEPACLASHSDDLVAEAWNVYTTRALDGIYFLASDSSTGSTYNSSISYKLFHVPIDGKELGQPELVDNGVSAFSNGMNFMGKPWYLTTAKGSSYIGDLYTVSGSERDRLCYDISYLFSPVVYNGGESMLYFENFNASRGMGELYLLTGNGEKVLVGEDVSDYYYRSDDLIYILRNMRAGKGDLYVWTGADYDLVDYDVTAVLDDLYHDPEDME